MYCYLRIYLTQAPLLVAWSLLDFGSQILVSQCAYALCIQKVNIIMVCFCIIERLVRIATVIAVLPSKKRFVDIISEDLSFTINFNFVGFNKFHWKYKNRMKSVTVQGDCNSFFASIVLCMGCARGGGRGQLPHVPLPP